MQLDVNDYKPNEVAKIIREWTELTQADFAKSIHRSPKTIEGYEYGTRNISLAVFMKMCKVHNINIRIEKINKHI